MWQRRSGTARERAGVRPRVGESPLTLTRALARACAPNSVYMCPCGTVGKFSCRAPEQWRPTRGSSVEHYCSTRHSCCARRALLQSAPIACCCSLLLLYCTRTHIIQYINVFICCTCIMVHAAPVSLGALGA